MTKDVIELAREAGMNPNADKDAVNALGSSVPQHWLAHFAALVAAREREWCAKACETVAASWSFHMVAPSAAMNCAAAIRALNTEGDVHDR